MGITSKISILIVDDNDNQCKTMSIILSYKDYEVVTANDGFEAIRGLRERPFDMIFIDIRMPGMDGVETYRRIKAIRPDVETVMITAYTVENLVQQAMDEGVKGIMYKPLDMDRVLASLE